MLPIATESVDSTSLRGDKWRKQEDDIGDRLRQLGVKVARLNIVQEASVYYQSV